MRQSLAYKKWETARPPCLGAPQGPAGFSSWWRGRIPPSLSSTVALVATGSWGAVTVGLGPWPSSCGSTHDPALDPPGCSSRAQEPNTRHSRGASGPWLLSSPPRLTAQSLIPFAEGPPPSWCFRRGSDTGSIRDPTTLETGSDKDHMEPCP